MPVTILMEKVAYGVQSLPNGNYALGFQDQVSGITVTVPLTEDDAKKIAHLLKDTGIVIANGMP
jgi:hypothetical protein